MDFIAELVRSMFSYIVYVAIAVAGFMLGMTVRKKKNSKNNSDK